MTENNWMPAMSNKMHQLARQSESLVTQIAIQRRDIARQATSLQAAAHFIDKIRAGILYLKARREALLLPLALIIISRPRRIFAFFLSALGMWRLIQKWRRALR